MHTAVLQAQHIFNSLNEIWEYALSNNPENAIYHLRIEQASQNKKAANSYLYPKVGVAFSGQKNIDIPETPVPGELTGNPGETAYLEFGQKYSYNSGITTRKSILDWQSKYQAKIAKLNVRLISAQKDYFEQTLKEQIAQVYYASLVTNEAVRISHKNLEIADSLLFISKDRFEQGLIDGLVFNQAKINKNIVLNNLEQLKQYQNRCLYNLKLFLGLTATDSLLLKESISTSSHLQFINYSGSNDIYTRLYSLKLDISEAEIKKSSARFAPGIDIVHYYGVQQFQHDFTLSFNSSDWKPNNYVGISLSIPVFTGFSNISQFKSAKISRDIAEKQLQDEIRKSAINDSILLSNYISSVKLVTVNSESFKDSKNNVELAAQKYAQGLISLDEYLKVFDDYLIMENQYFNSLSDYLINKATIEARSNVSRKKYEKQTN